MRKIGLLVNSDTWDRAQLLAKQMQQYGISVIVFSTLDVACIWLNLDPQITRERIHAIALPDDLSNMNLG